MSDFIIDEKGVLKKYTGAYVDYFTEIQRVADKALTFDMKKVERFANTGAKLAIIDMGIKKSIMENFRMLNCDITLFPADTKVEDIEVDNFDALVISNGPGNPEDCPVAVEELKKMMREYANHGNCVFVTSHNIELVSKLCDRVAIVNNGEIATLYDLNKNPNKRLQLSRIFIETYGG